MGGALSAPAIMGILKGCAPKPGIAWKPQFFNEDQAIVVTQVADIIIPKTNTAGAAEAGVPGFIDLMLKDVYKKEEQDYFLAELKAFDDAAQQAHGDPFIKLSAEDQKSFVYQQHEAAVKAEKSDKRPEKRPFILMMKELTMLGYFTSKVGATEVLQYEAVPGAYKGCIPLKEAGNGKTWAV